MTRIGTRLVFATCIVVVASGGVRAQACDVPQNIRSFAKQYGGTWTVQQDGDCNVRAIIGRSRHRVQYLGDEQDFLSGFLPLLGITGAKYITTTQSRTGVHLRYRYTVPNMPEMSVNALITISVDRAGRLISIMASPPLPVTVKQLTLATVEDFKTKLLQVYKRSLAKAIVGFEPLTLDGATLDIDFALQRSLEIAGPELFAKKSTVIWVYRVILRDRQGHKVVEVTFDASDVAIPVVERRKFVYEAPQGRIFRPNPRTTQREPTLDLNEVPDEAYTIRRLRGLNPARSGEFALCGEYVCITEEPSPVYSLTGKFMQPRGTLEFASVMAYYYIDWMQRYVQSLGFENLVDYPIRVDVRATSQGVNGYYYHAAAPYARLEFEKNVMMYAAEDVDVVAHEYGHALQSAVADEKYASTGGSDDEQLKMIRAQTSAMAEGFGDYWSFSVLLRLGGWRGACDLCYAEWSHQDECERIIDVNRTADSFWPNMKAHANGIIWAAALLRLRDALGRRTTDRLVLESHAYVQDSPTFCEGGMALVAADQALYKGRYRQVVQQVMQRARIFDGSDERLRCQTTVIGAL